MNDSILTLCNKLTGEGFSYGKSPDSDSGSMLINKQRVNLRDVALAEYNGKKSYRCALRKKKQRFKYFILYIEKDFYILPANRFNQLTLCISPVNLKKHYGEYRNNWGLLK